MIFKRIFFFITLANLSLANEFNHTLPDDFKSDYETDKHEASFENLQDSGAKEEDLFKKKGEKDVYFSEKKDLTLQQKESFNLIQSELPGKFEKSQKYQEHSDLEIISSVSDKAGSSFTLSYFRDNYSYEGGRAALFEDIYERSTGSQRMGLLLFSYKEYLTRFAFPVAIGWNLGLGYNKGRGRFSQVLSESNTQFSLWTIPADLTVSVEFPLWQWIKITGSGGPSIMGLYQTRDDFTDDDNKKHRRQIGIGFFIAGKLQFNISKFFPSKGIKVLADNRVSSLFVNLETRLQNYRNFQDPFTLTGISFGLGFSFEFL